MHLAMSPQFSELVDPDAEVELLATGFEFVEGPLWHDDGYLLFSDMPGDVRRRWWSEEGRIEEVARPTNMANGLAFDAQGRLIVCEHATSRLARFEPDGRTTLLASHLGGRELNSPNDVVVRSDGTTYFTDPLAGRKPFFGIERVAELDFQGVYRVREGGDPELLVADFDTPNGLCFSREESALYVNDTTRRHIRVFGVDEAGALTSGDVLFTFDDRDDLGPGVPDGMKTDQQGNLWCTGPGGVWVISARGEQLGVLRVPEKTANLAWGGRDRDQLYLTASTSLYRVRTLVRGHRMGPRR